MWRGVYVRRGSGIYDVTTLRVRKDGQPDRRSRPASWGAWTPRGAAHVLNSPDAHVCIAGTSELTALRDALRRLASEPDQGGI